MSYSVGGPVDDKDFDTWGSLMTYATWGRCDSTQAQATAEDGSLFMNGINDSIPPVVQGMNFYMSSGFESLAILFFSPYINSEYVPEFVGKIVTPCGQGEPVQPGTSFDPSPCAPFGIDGILFVNYEQILPDPPRPNGSYFTGFESIEGFTDQT